MDSSLLIGLIGSCWILWILKPGTEHEGRQLEGFGAL